MSNAFCVHHRIVFLASFWSDSKPHVLDFTCCPQCRSSNGICGATGRHRRPWKTKPFLYPGNCMVCSTWKHNRDSKVPVPEEPSTSSLSCWTTIISHRFLNPPRVFLRMRAMDLLLLGRMLRRNLSFIPLESRFLWQSH